MKLLFALIVLLALPLAAADLTGHWKAEVQIAGNTGNPSFTFQQDGSKLTGTYTGMLGEYKLNGTVDGNKVRFEFKANYEGNALNVVYTGTIESPTSMKGTIDFGGAADGSFTAQKDK
ncbi:hypothetical protein [Paludibaculum fermentans]|uniref:Extracellular endo-alpha-(1->5)-L-arabinanase C-terminal domain-containing protein n=1 Tax=Paludibaculum fermentans TaxID=1473598 RepID=A0A7S7SKU2_PALFE|nr:hypothetical protein [Paludibaculum fermentans]QOY88073.1 hypothetical protein IRI77_35950 [Paludibaculum fermentans]